jgi:hypothetical protein
MRNFGALTGSDTEDVNTNMVIAVKPIPRNLVKYISVGIIEELYPVKAESRLPRRGAGIRF